MFSLVWLSFCFVFVSVVPFFDENGEGWWGLLFMEPIFGVGFWLLYLACRKSFREIEVRIERGEFSGKPIETKGVILEPKGNGVFFLTVKNRLAPWLVGGGVVTIVIGGAMMLGSGTSGGNGGAFGFVEALFNGIGFLASIVPVLGGIVALVRGTRTLGNVSKYVFYGDRIEFARVKRGGRVEVGKSWPKAEVTDVVVSRAGESNGELRYRVQLRAGENVNLVSFASPEVADELEGWIRNWMGAGENS